MVLVIDIGNSHLKWAWWDGQDLSAVERMEHRGVFPDSLATQWGAATRPDRVLVSNVAGQTMADSLAAWSEARWGLRPLFLRSQAKWQGVVNGYEKPETLGIDRWLALVAAFSRFRKAVLIVDCGTAITLDAVDAAGQHLGGLILPGFDLARRAVLSGTNIPICRPNGKMPLFAQNTADAVGAAPAQAVAALVRHAVDELSAEGEVTLVLTGGGIEEIKPLLGSMSFEEAELVIDGLVLAARTGLE